MPKCAHCGTMILFGGKRSGALRFCNAKCQSQSALAGYSEEIPQDIVMQRAIEIRESPCPRCQKPGPIDFHEGHTIVSFLVATQWNTKPLLGCNRCGRAHKLKCSGICLTCGWWGIPWGVIGTPIQLIRNLSGYSRGVGESPSEMLKQMAMAQIGLEIDRRSSEMEDADGPSPHDPATTRASGTP